MMVTEDLVRRPADVLAGAVVGSVGVVYTIIALQTPPATSSASVIGPAAFPTILGVLLALGGAAVAIGGLRLRHAEPKDTTEESEDDATPRGGRPLWITLAIFGAYILAFIPVGYLLSTMAFILGLTSYYSRGKWRSNLIYAVVFSLVVFGMFEYLLGVRLPQGVLAGVLP